MADRRGPIPTSVAVLFGVSMAGYGVGLAAVTGLQAAAEEATRAARAPADDALVAAEIRSEALRARVDRANAEAEAALSGYRGLATAVGDLHAAVAALSGSVGRIDGDARALPTSIRVPTVVRAASTSRAASPHATTGGSGAP